MPRIADIKKVMVIGSGPIVIGQAAEFDYAGTQACRVLREEGVNVVLLDGHDAAFDWVRAHRGDYAAFATCGARDPHLPALARRIAAEVDAE
jgi:hypothetical protein